MSDRVIKGYAGFTAQEIAEVRYAARKHFDKRMIRRNRKRPVAA